MITVVDYGMGNLRSVQKGFEKVGAEAEVTSDPEAVAKATKLVVPGVGAFGAAMDGLRRLHLVEPIHRAIRRGVPYFGICLGLQLLFERSQEEGEHAGLGLFAGDVVRFAFPEADRERKIPHMGWNTIEFERPGPLLEGIPSGTYFYFVHSYYVRPAEPSVVAATTDYGLRFTSMIHRENVTATQFHPEKSQAAGLRMLANFARL